MENSDLTKKLKKISTAGDLATVLDEIKQNEFGSVRYSISIKMLKHFSSDTIAPKRFRTFHIRKKSGGLREIKAPCSQLDVILTCVNILLKSIYGPSDVAMGFTSGRSVLNNSQIHVGHNYVFNIDLKDLRFLRPESGNAFNLPHSIFRKKLPVFLPAFVAVMMLTLTPTYYRRAPRLLPY